MMSQWSKSSSGLEKFYDFLQNSGLWESLEFGDLDLADTLWLALQIDRVEEKSPVSPSKGKDKDKQDKSKNKQPQKTRSSSSLDVITTEDHKTLEKELDTTKATPPSLPIKIPAAPTLQNNLTFHRALRPLMRKVPSIHRTILDVETTIYRIAEKDLWQPVTKPDAERWLTLELVIEEWRSSFIWRELWGNLRQLFYTQGAFRDVRLWQLSATDNQHLQLVRRTQQGKIRQHSYRELLHPDGRGLILLVSDCVSPLWKQALIHPWLKEWSEKQHTAILQLFPEQLWNSTQLSRGRKFFATAATPGCANSRLLLKNYSVWLRDELANTFVIPVINLEPQVINQWSRVVAGKAEAEVPTYLFDLDFVQEKAGEKTTPTSGNKEPSAEEIVSHFFNTASRTAQKLATLMAAAPVNMSVVNLVRKALLPQAKPVHVAEFYMGGLLEPQDQNQEDGYIRLYDFKPGVRQELNLAIATHRSIEVLNAITDHISQKLGRSLLDFRAFLTKLPEFELSQQKEVYPFASITLEVLNNLGGEYAAFAKNVESSLSTAGVYGFWGINSDLFTSRVAKLELVLKFETVYVNIRGEKIKTQACEATGYELLLGEDFNQPGAIARMIYIPSGKYLMGSPDDEKGRFKSESPQHEVDVTEFYLSQTPITEVQWRFVAKLPQEARKLKESPSQNGDNYPVTRVSWYDAVEFCARLSRYTGRNYRLPSEAEWEYACRAGTTTPFHFGETIRSDLACYYSKYVYQQEAPGKHRMQIKEVGNFYPNAFGLYDMHGNVLEWCGDSWHSDYLGAPNNSRVWDDNPDYHNDYLNNINKLLNASSTKVCRGGSWDTDRRVCRSAYRVYLDPGVDYDDDDLGLRVAYVARSFS